MAGFDIERFVSLSKAIDTSDIDWAEVKRIGITDDEWRVLRYMSDTESHTILYLRDLLAGHTASDPEVCAFMACWVYEETHHGRALDRLMAEAGRPPSADRYREVNSKLSMREEITRLLSNLAAYATPHFAAAHMCWGAINELTAALSYTALARRTRNPQLAKLATRLARDERKHYAFYYQQAERRLERGGWKAQILCRETIRRFWEPVGIGVGEPHTLEFISSYLLGDAWAASELDQIDQTIGQLPGMSWFKMVRTWTDAGFDRFRSISPTEFARHRQLEEQRQAA